MERAQRIAIAKQLLEMIDRNETEYGDEPAWEADIGRFTDKERFLKEKEEFFHNRPQVIAYTADIPKNGDYYATELAGKPILLTRGKDGKARAFLNACRHRGVQLAEGCGHGHTFTCPYHAWTFNSHGDLIGVPSRDAFDGLLSDRGLIALPASHILISRRTKSDRAILEMARTTCEQCLLCTELCPRHIIGHELPPHLIVRSVNYHHFGQPSTLLSALTCSECAICEAWSCPVDISPMKLNQMLKVQLRKEGARYVGPLHEADPMAEHRLVPTSRLITKLGIGEYNRKAPLDETPYHAARVVLPLRQHVGAPSVPCVQVGEVVQVGQLIAEIAPNALGARIHASISGTVESVSDSAITLAA